MSIRAMPQKVRCKQSLIDEEDDVDFIVDDVYDVHMGYMGHMFLINHESGLEYLFKDYEDLEEHFDILY